MAEPTAVRRDHIFISYAWEDSAFAEWLALKLTAEGYAVWIDRFKLLGGEPFPEDIDDAIKHRTFRLVALLSQHSIHKPNPRKERTLALSLGRERKEDFLIPLNVDGLRPTDLDWMLSDLTFIPFQESWAAGLGQLLKKLVSLDAPRPVENGRDVAASVFLPRDILIPEPETLRSNLFAIQRLPDTLKSFRLARPLARVEERQLAKKWAFRAVNSSHLLAFRRPPIPLVDNELVAEKVIPWREAETVEGIRPIDLVSELLKKSLERKCIERGLVWADGKWIPYFPVGLLPKDQIVFPGYKRKTTRVQVAGVRKFFPSKYRYHLSPSFTIRRGLMAPLVVQLRILAYLTDLDGKPLKSELIGPRRKRLSRGWWNHEWLLRHLAVAAHLADGGPIITIGDGDEMISISAEPLSHDVRVRIDERALRGPELSAAESAEDLEDAA